jgi:hypothetical protein
MFNVRLLQRWLLVIVPITTNDLRLPKHDIFYNHSSVILEPAHGILQRMKDEQIVFSLRKMAWLMLVISRHKDAIQACKMMFTKEAKELVKWLEKNYDDVYKELYLSLPKSCVSTAWNNMV